MIHHDREALIGEKLLRNEPLSQQEVALLFGVCKQRIYEIEQRAMRKLRLAIQTDEELRSLAEEVE